MVFGQKGNEGKIWFQEYLKTFYGYARVVRLDLKMNTENVLHVLTKQPLINEPRAFNHESSNYSILESINDGTTVLSMYNNDIISIQVLKTQRENRTYKNNFKSDDGDGDDDEE